MKYDKIPLSFDEQVNLLKKRGLKINNTQYAVKFLKEVSYYRLSAYFYPFLKNKENHIYYPNITFSMVAKLYIFDSELRRLLVSALESAEIFLRTNLTCSLVFSEKNPFCYLDKNNYSDKFIGRQILYEDLLRLFSREKSKKLWKLLIKNKNLDAKGLILEKQLDLNVFEKKDEEIIRSLFNNNKYDDFLKEVESSFNSSHEEFVRHYKNKYLADSPSIPLWMVTEMLSFGRLSKLFGGLNSNLRNVISKKYNIPYKVLYSWMHSLVYVRNICAHHARLWNRELVIAPRSPKKMVENQYWSKRLFSILIVLKYTVSPSFNWKKFVNKIRSLLRKNSFINITKMGFPKDWKKILLLNKYYG